MNRHEQARKAAQEVAEVLGVGIADRAVYTWHRTGAASAWRILGNKHNARMAVNVEDLNAIYALVETGPVSNPEHHIVFKQVDGTGWIDQGEGQGGILSALGSAHPILH